MTKAKVVPVLRYETEAFITLVIVSVNFIVIIGFLTTHILSIEHTTWLKLYDMLKARDAYTGSD